MFPLIGVKKTPSLTLNFHWFAAGDWWTSSPESLQFLSERSQQQPLLTLSLREGRAVSIKVSYNAALQSYTEHCMLMRVYTQQKTQ